MHEDRDWIAHILEIISSDRVEKLVCKPCGLIIASDRVEKLVCCRSIARCFLLVGLYLKRTIQSDRTTFETYDPTIAQHTSDSVGYPICAARFLHTNLREDSTIVSENYVLAGSRRSSRYQLKKALAVDSLVVT